MAVHAFTSGAGGAFVARVDATERAVLVHVVDQVVELLGGADAADGTPFRLGAAAIAPPEDPALLRLLPDGSKADADVAAEFRRLTEVDLRATKVTNLLRLRVALDEARPLLVVGPETAPGVAAALTDVRLVIADRLDLRTDADAEALDAMLLAALAGGDDGAEDEPDDELDEGPDSEVDEGPDDQPDNDEPDAPDRPDVVFLASVYQVLGMLQESLVELMLDALPDGDEPDAAAWSR